MQRDVTCVKATDAESRLGYCEEDVTPGSVFPELQGPSRAYSVLAFSCFNALKKMQAFKIVLSDVHFVLCPSKDYIEVTKRVQKVSALFPALFISKHIPSLF